MKAYSGAPFSRHHFSKMKKEGLRAAIDRLAGTSCAWCQIIIGLQRRIPVATREETKGHHEQKGGFLVKGILIPESWDQNGNIVRIAIATAGEENFLVDLKGKGKDVVRLIREKVTVVGQVREEGNQRILEVEDYWLG
jgi:hypothetical protein